MRVKSRLYKIVSFFLFAEGGSPVPVICGYNTGQHMYIDAGTAFKNWKQEEGFLRLHYSYSCLKSKIAEVSLAEVNFFDCCEN